VTEIPKGFCILPWVHLSTTPSGTYRVCCNSSHSFLFNDPDRPLKIFRHPVSEAWNSNVMRDLRLQMVNGEIPEMCKKCHREEDAGMTSPRNSWNTQHSEIISESIQKTSKDGSVEENLVFLDLRLGNLCNLRCVMCSPYSSNQWLEEWEKVQDQKLEEGERERLALPTWVDEKAVMDHLSKHVATLRSIYLTGGEPTLAKGQYDLLNLCIEKGFAKNISLEYNTNLTNIPQKLLDYWQHFKSVKINSSIDGLGALDEYIRFPTKWEVIDKNLRTLNDLSAKFPHLDVHVHTCVQATNVLSLTPLLDYLLEFKNITNYPFLNVLDYPAQLNIRILPENLKRLAADRLLEWKKKVNLNQLTLKNSADQQEAMDRIDQVITYMNQEDRSNLFAEFGNYISRLESLRGNSLYSIVPELKN
jgi:sulfatase maturation enzyme AslB (radical SAM superfamily)